MVGLHSSDPATVYLSAWARVPGFVHGDLEAALYDDRALLRMLGMRRTMFVVPPDLAAVMQSACTDALLAPERRRLVKMLGEQGIATDPEAWLVDVESRVLSALEGRGEATAVELTEDVPELGTKLMFGAGKKWGGTIGLSTRVLFFSPPPVRSCAAGPGARGCRANTAGRRLQPGWGRRFPSWTEPRRRPIS